MFDKKYIVFIVIVLLLNALMFKLFDLKKSNDITKISEQSPLLTSILDADEIEGKNFGRRTAITEAVKKIAPAVVSVNVMRTQMVSVNPFWESFFLEFYDTRVRREVQSIATGVVISGNGYILTNAHVVEGATDIKVVCSNNLEYDAELIGLDSLHDIAVLKIDCQNMVYANIGTSSDIMIGEWAIAVGNPYGFLMKDSKPSVSIGVISALDRTFSIIENNKVYKGMLQTDAAINPGNSGGPLVNINGEVIGINSFIITESGSSAGMGFAIPIDRAKKITEELVTYGHLRKVYYGIKIQEITPLMGNVLKLSNLDGVIISVVEPNSPSSEAGLKRGDIITRINGDYIKNTMDVEIAISDIAPYERMNLNVSRDGREYELIVVAGDYDEYSILH